MMITRPFYTWRVASIATALMLLLILAIHYDTLIYLTGLWNQIGTGDYAHGYLVLAISVYLIASNRQTLSRLAPCPNFLALIAVLAAALVLLAATVVDVQMMQAASLLLVILAMVWALLGTRVSLQLSLPILFIGFAIPVWFPLSTVLQSITADATFWLVRLTNVPAFMQENIIVLPAGRLSVEEACGGLNYLLAALTLGTLYAYLNYSSVRARLVVVLIAATTAVVANIIRVYIVVYLAYESAMQHPMVTDHLSLGWAIFGGLMFILMLIDSVAHRYWYTSSSAAVVTESSIPVTGCNKSRRQFVVLVAAIIAIVTIGPVTVNWANQQGQAGSADASFSLPRAAGAWTVAAGYDSWQPEFHGAIDSKQIYVTDYRKVTLYVGYYPVQQQGQELINDLNRISNSDLWKKKYSRARSYTYDDSRVLEQIIHNAVGEQRLVWYWYNVAGQQTINKYQAKVLQILGILTAKRESYVIAIATDYTGDIDQARDTLADFSSALAGVVKQVIDGR